MSRPTKVARPTSAGGDTAQIQMTCAVVGAVRPRSTSASCGRLCIFDPGLLLGDQALHELGSFLLVGLHAIVERLAPRDRQHCDCATWLHKGREMPKEDFRREAEKGPPSASSDLPVRASREPVNDAFAWPKHCPE